MFGTAAQAAARWLAHGLSDSSFLRPIIVTPWYGGTHGGVAVATESLAHAIIEAGGDCAVVRMAPDGIRPRRVRGSVGEEIVELCVRSAVLSNRSLVRRAGFGLRRRIAENVISRLAAKHDAKVAHFNFAVPGYDTLMDIARARGLAVVTTFHGSDVNVTLAHASTRAMVERMIVASDRVAVVSRTLYDRVVAAIPSARDRVMLVHNVVPASFARMAAAARASVVVPRWDALLVGQLIQRKGGDILIDAVARIARSRPGIRVALAGSGEFESQLRAQASALGVSANVEFVGELSRGELLAAYAASRTLVIPSRSEGLPLVLLEAQWMGIPTVASNVDGLPEAIADGENGLLFPPGDSTALAEALLSLLNNESLRAAMGARAAVLARDRFAPSVSVTEYQGVYAEAIRVRASEWKAA